MIQDYGEDYIDSVMENLGDMMEYATYDLSYEPEVFYRLFLASGLDREIERGNPKYTVGMSGVELFHFL